MIEFADTERWRRLYPALGPKNERDHQVLQAFMAEFGPMQEDMEIHGVDYDRRVVLLRVARRRPDGPPVEMYTFAECNTDGWITAKKLWLEPEARRRADLSRVLMATWPAPPETTIY
ncbi:MAG: hypothetical protein HYR63_07955 [Proteobacteria bacterium]|nr:hypothetical protein [Pseudomonadota bacterium]MBI3497771.1 hypothetical protein [Pseudomonadota bacterium]